MCPFQHPRPRVTSSIAKRWGGVGSTTVVPLLMPPWADASRGRLSQKGAPRQLLRAPFALAWSRRAVGQIGTLVPESPPAPTNNAGKGTGQLSQELSHAYLESALLKHPGPRVTSRATHRAPGHPGPRVTSRATHRRGDSKCRRGVLASDLTSTRPRKVLARALAGRFSCTGRTCPSALTSAAALRPHGGLVHAASGGGSTRTWPMRCSL